MKKHNLVWGESICVRQAFLEQISCVPDLNSIGRLLEMDYTPFNGDLDLIEETRKVIKRQTGLEYKHIFLTNGASGGCTIALRAYSKLGYQQMATNPAPWFPLYPSMAYASELTHIVPKGDEWLDSTVLLLDSPHNPTGKHQDVPSWAHNTPVIWDSVYYTGSYMAITVTPPEHEVIIGSYSKLTGVNGIRLGWIATNNHSLAREIEILIGAEYCGLSAPSMALLKNLLFQYNLNPGNWDTFEKLARYRLDCNRENWSKLEKYFGGTPVPPNGMFHYAPMDKSCKDLLEKSGVLWMPGSKCGHSDDFGRFNIGQSNEIVNDAVKAIIKADKI